MQQVKEVLIRLDAVCSCLGKEHLQVSMKIPGDLLDGPHDRAVLKLMVEELLSTYFIALDDHAKKRTGDPRDVAEPADKKAAGESMFPGPRTLY